MMDLTITNNTHLFAESVLKNQVPKKVFEFKTDKAAENVG